MNAFSTSRTMLGGGLLAALLIAGCSGGSAGGATDSQSPSGGGNVGNAANGFRPAASGVIAAITGRTLQVQSESEQTAVTYSAGTKFTAERTTNLAAVTAGSCILATAKTNKASSTQVHDLTADDVRIEPARNGSCGGGPRANGPVGAGPSGFPTSVPSGGVVQGAPPSGAPNGARTMVGSAIAGKVTAVHGTTITVAMTVLGTSSSTSNTTGTVHVTDATDYTTTGAATHAALKVGLCAVVSGAADNTGAVAATRIALSRKTNGSCNLVIGGGPNG